MKNAKLDIKKVKDVMSFQGRKQTWISQTLGVEPETVSVWLSGKRDFPSQYIAPLAVALGVPVSFISK